MTHKYAIIIYWSEVDDAFIAKVPELPGCFADGPTYEDALSMIQEVMDIWIETNEERGYSIPEPNPQPLLVAEREPVYEAQLETATADD